jgi:hypothetical protein
VIKGLIGLFTKWRTIVDSAASSRAIDARKWPWRDNAILHYLSSASHRHLHLTERPLKDGWNPELDVVHFPIGVRD